MEDDTSMKPDELEAETMLEASHAAERLRRIVAKKKIQNRNRLLAILFLLFIFLPPLVAAIAILREARRTYSSVAVYLEYATPEENPGVLEPTSMVKVTVSCESGIATGTVTFTWGKSVFGKGDLTNGSSEVLLTGWQAESNSPLLATYDGDVNCRSSSTLYRLYDVTAEYIDRMLTQLAK